MVAVVALDSRSPMQVPSPGADAFLRFYGTVCAVPSVAVVGLVIDDPTWHVWIRLGRDDEADQDQIYAAMQQYRASGTLAGHVDIDLHVVFPNEDPAAVPGAATVLFARE
jgi:hypothetical protein